MKIAIAYATKTGTTREAAQKLAELLQARGFTIQLCNLADTKPDADADAVALGGSIRAGHWHTLAVQYAKQNEATLLGKPLALFACRCGKEEMRPLLAGQIGEKLVSHAVYVDGFGGVMELAKQKGFERFIVNMILKHDKSGNGAGPGILDENILACADALTRGLAG